MKTYALSGLILGGIGAALAALAAPVPAYAAQPDERDSALIEEIVVTARRRAETAQSVPIPVTALSGDQLRDRVIEDMADLSRVTPNLDFKKSASNKGAAQVFLRGIGQVNWSPSQDPKVGIYLDGVYLGRPQGAVFDLVDVERVEVLRGPQGTLFGRNTTAGLIQVITNKPTQEFEASVGVGAGNEGQLSANGVVNIPISDQLATRFSFQHRESDGYVDNRSTGQDWSDENSQILRGSVLWTPSDSFDLQLTADYQRAREHAGLGSCTWTGPDDGSSTLGTGGLPFLAYVFGVYDEIKDTCNATAPYNSTDNDPDESTIDAYGLNLTFNWDLGLGVLTSITSHRSTEDLNASWGWATDAVGTASYLEILANSDSQSRQWSQEFRLAGTGFGDALDWVVGVYGFEEKGENPIDVPIFRGVQAPDCADWPLFCAPVPNAGGLTFGDIALGAQFFGSRFQQVTGENSSVAVFGEVSYRFAERWELTTGVRYTEDDRKVERYQVLSSGLLDPAWICPGGGAPAGGTVCKKQTSFDELTPRAILSYQLSDDIMLYGGWSKGYSSGGFNQDVRLRSFDPETSGNWEAGMKSIWLDQRLLVNLTGFYNSYENQQITVARLVDGLPTADLINAQEATLYGVEGEFRFIPAEGWTIMGSFGWIDGEYDEFTVLDNVLGPPPDFESIQIERDLSDVKVISGAPYTYSISAAYTHYLSDGGDVTGQVGWAERGRSYSTLESLPSSKQKPYGLMDARLTWHMADGKTTVSLWGSNLLDEEYFNSAIDLPDSFYVTKYWGEPRRFGLEINHSFAN